MLLLLCALTHRMLAAASGADGIGVNDTSGAHPVFRGALFSAACNPCAHGMRCSKSDLLQCAMM